MVRTLWHAGRRPTTPAPDPGLGPGPGSARSARAGVATTSRSAWRTRRRAPSSAGASVRHRSLRLDPVGVDDIAARAVRGTAMARVRAEGGHGRLNVPRTRRRDRAAVPGHRIRFTVRVARVSGGSTDGSTDGAADDLAWIPSSVGAAARTGTLGADSLHSGQAWAMLLAALGEAGEFLHSARLPPGGESDAAGYRHLMVLLALGVDEALRSSDPYEPVDQAGTSTTSSSGAWTAPTPSTRGASIRPDATYRIWGHRGSARFVHFQVMAGIGNIGDAVADDMAIADDGTFELFLSTRTAGRQLAAPGRGRLVVGHPPVLLRLGHRAAGRRCRSSACRSRPVGPAPSPARRSGRPASWSPWATSCATACASGGTSRRWVATGDRTPSARRGALGHRRRHRQRHGVGLVGPGRGRGAHRRDDAAAGALYWSISIGNQWWETIDYARHQSSLNGHQAVARRRGFRGVVAAPRPGRGQLARYRRQPPRPRHDPLGPGRRRPGADHHGRALSTSSTPPSPRPRPG